MGPLLMNIGPMEGPPGPHPNFEQNAPIEPLLENLGPIEPLLKNIGPIEPLLKNIGPIEPHLEKLGPIGPNSQNTAPIEPLKTSGPIEPVLKTQITEKFNKLTANNPILLERHRDVVNKIHLGSVNFSNNIKGIDDVAILSSELNILGHSLTELIGIVSPDDVLNSIFSNFCIGK